MQKIKRTIVSLVALALFSLVPIGVYAQTPNDVLVVGEQPTTSEVAGIPETGIAPAESQLLQSTLVFITGGLLGAGIGLGVITFKKKQSN